MNVLLSIKPKYVEAITDGNKKYDFRKVIFKNKDVDKVYIYATAPVKKIVGSFIIGDIAKDSPEELWNQFKEFSGINDSEFFCYFRGCDTGFAIKIEELDLFKDPIDPREQFHNFVPPQSFCYTDISIS